MRPSLFKAWLGLVQGLTSSSSSSSSMNDILAFTFSFLGFLAAGAASLCTAHTGTRQSLRGGVH